MPKKKPAPKLEKVETQKKQSSFDQYTIEEMITALTKARGMKTIAAKALGCAYNTVVRYMETYPEVAQAAHDAHENMLDAVELKLFDNCMKGDTTALIFALKTKGRNRGYAEKIDLNVDLGVLRELTALLESRGQRPSDIFLEMLQEMKNADVANPVS